MKLLFSNEGAAILSGAVLAAVAGFTLGGAMRPQLIFDERPTGPQMFASAGGPRSSGPVDPGGAHASYSGNIPSYVTGADDAQAAANAQEPPIAGQNEAVKPDPAPLSRAPYYEDPPPVVVYPSEAGGSTYHAETSPPAPPPEDPAPTITG